MRPFDPAEAPDWSRLPAPEDYGATAHLPGLRLPPMALPASDGRRVDLAGLAGLTVVYAYPRTGRPGVPLPQGWDAIPGARGCTQQACAFRDHFAELAARGVTRIFGLSTQSGAEQAEVAARLHLPFPLLSDAGLALADALRLPHFEAGGETLLKRLTLVIGDGTVLAALDPVFPPDAAPRQVMAWLDDRG